MVGSGSLCSLKDDMASKTRKINEYIQNQLKMQVIDSEYKISKANQSQDVNEFESYVDLLDSVREPKDYDWMSDIRLPEFLSRILTQTSIDVAQYFQTRDFVEAYLEDESDVAKNASDAAKECINRTLNQRHLYHYQKFVRGKIINHLHGKVYIRCWWEQKMRPVITDYQHSITQSPQMDESGEPMMDEMGNPMMTMNENKIPVMGEEPEYDRFNYDILDPRNVFTDNKYVYSLQEKNWVIIRSESSYEELKSDEDLMGYFNLDKLLEEKDNGNKKTKRKTKARGETDTSQETYNKFIRYSKENRPVNPSFDILERHGKYWAIVKERDQMSEEPIEIEPGIDENGEPLESAEFIETIMTFAVNSNVKELIRFQVAPYHDATGRVYRPIIRGLCYLHPTKDGGTGDGKSMREIQLGIDDTFNISNDRVLLATLPTLVAAKGSNIDNDTIRFEPNHVIREEAQGDVRELKMSSDIGGALEQIGMLQSSGDKVMSIFPTTMGELPGKASTTATAVSATSGQSNVRTNYKSLTYENTALCDLYWMIMQMTFQFAKPETGVKLIGDKVKYFDPKKDYYYKPVSASIETEFSKQVKIKDLLTMYGYTMQSQNPKAPMMANLILEKIFSLQGDEQANFASKLYDENSPIASPKSGQLQPGAPTMPPMSNQNGMPQSPTEQLTRMGSNGG